LVRGQPLAREQQGDRAEREGERGGVRLGQVAKEVCRALEPPSAPAKPQS
jgi:hypothetical protein